MDFLRIDPENAAGPLRAVTGVARAARSGFARPQRAVVEAIRRRVLGSDREVDDLAPIAAEELARCGGSAPERRQSVRLMVVTSLADGPPSAEQMRMMRAYAEALGVNEPAVDVVGHLARGRVLRFKLAFARHAHVRIYLRNSYRLLGGVFPLVKAVLRFRGVLGEDTALAARFHALEDLPEDTLGRCFFRHCRDAELAFSGEKGGFPPGALYHDFTHVLAGYDTTPEGEMKAAAFQAGFTTHPDDFFTALFAIVIHTAGVNLTPFDMPVRLGRIGEGTLADDVLRAWERGAAMKVDLGDGWDFWEDVNLPIEVVRERLGVVPLRATA